jgi:uncharacterized coiled-coil protein SlyX
MIQALTNRVEELETQIEKANKLTNKQSHQIAALTAERDQLASQLKDMQERVLDAYKQGWQDGVKNK